MSASLITYCKMMKERGMMGVGTLIVFISVILVAAVAASVLYSTASGLSQRGLATGSQTEQGVSAGAEAISVLATDGSAGHDLEFFELITRLQPGSGTLNLNFTILMVDTSSSSQTLTYNGTLSSDSETSATTADYMAYYIKTGPEYQPGYMSKGDVVKLKFRCSDCSSGEAGGIGENKRVRIRVIPRLGNPVAVEFTTPDAITQNRVSLWP